MKTCLDIPSYHFIDTAPLAVRYEVMMAALLTLLDLGRYRDMLRHTHKIVRLVRMFSRLEAQNFLLQRKLDMLMDKPWRERVLKELGGLRRLKSWEAAAARNATPHKSFAHDFNADSVWLDTPERRAESERLKAHAKKCAKACASPNIFRDEVRMDFDGMFRLAPLPRRESDVRPIKIYTKGNICDYVYNAVPFAPINGFGPATIWPAEFRAAAKAEAALAAEGDKDNVAEKGIEPSTISTLHIIDTISYAAYTDIFYDPPEPPP